MNSINTKKTLLTLLALIMWGLMACVEEIPIGSFTYERLLVVDANISNLAKTHEVRLFYTEPVGQSPDNEPNAVSEALVWIESSDGDVINFTEQAPGYYQSPANFAGIVGKSYALFIVTNDGKKYQSSFEELAKAPKISRVYDRLAFKATDLGTNLVPGIQFFIDIDNAQEGSQFYRYEWNDAHQIIMPYVKKFQYQRGSNPDIVPYDKDVKECYKEQSSTQLILATSTTSNGQLKELDIKFAPASVFDLTTTYSIEIIQRAVSAEAYSYYRKIKLFNESNGSLFDKQQGAVIGNMVSVDDPNEKVLGYFEVSGASSKRIFVNPFDLNREVHQYFNRTCEKYSALQYDGSVPAFYAAEDVAEEIRGTQIAIRGQYELYDFEDGTGMKFFAHRLCVNCTRSGSLGKPDYWP